MKEYQHGKERKRKEEGESRTGRRIRQGGIFR